MRCVLYCINSVQYWQKATENYTERKYTSLIMDQHFIFLFIVLLVLGTVSQQKYNNGIKRTSKKCVCGRRTQKLEAPPYRIVGGNVMKNEEHPYLVFMIDKDEHVCGGTVVSPFHILTAAHCVENNTAVNMAVFLGLRSIKKLNEAKRIKVKNIIIHSGFKYDGGAKLHDIALLRTVRIKFNNAVQPICINFNREFEKFPLAYASGWGGSKLGGEPSELPRKATLQLMTPNRCLRSLWAHGIDVAKERGIEKMLICAYTPAVSVCQGDSGGPLFYENWAGTSFQIGVVSYGESCGNEDEIPTIYMSLTYYRNWLWEHLQDNICLAPEY